MKNKFIHGLYFGLPISFLLWILIFASGQACGATYTVCASGCNQTTIQAAVTAYTTAGDIIDVRADTVGGTKTYREQVTMAASGSSGSPITLTKRAGDTVIISGADIVTGFVKKPDVFYPDANPETTSVDGTVAFWVTNDTWANVRDAAGSTTGTSADNANDHISYIESGTTGWKSIRRGIFVFDTSSLADGATITSAVLSLYGQNKADGLGISPDVNVYAAAPASNTALAAGDFDSIGTTPFCDTPIGFSAFSTSGYNNFTLNADGLAAISKTSVTKLGTRNANYDAANSEPAYSASKISKLSIFFREEAGDAKDPKLSITLAETVIYVALCAWTPKVVVQDGVRLTSVESVAAIDGVGKWFADGTNLYIRCSDDADPSTHVIEASRRDSGIYNNAKSYITIQDLTTELANANGGVFVWTNSAASSNIIIQRVTSRNNYLRGIMIANAHATYRTTDLLVDSCVTYGNASSGIDFGGGAKTGIISNNISYDNTSTAVTQAGIHLGTGDVADVTIENNLSYNNISTGIHADTVGSGIVIRKNISRNNGHAGILVERMDGTLVSNNKVFENAEQGVIFYSWDAVGIHNNKIYNNTVLNNGSGGLSCFGFLTGSAGNVTGNLFKNNISTGNTPNITAMYGGENDGTNGSGNVYEYNCLGSEGTNFITWGATTPDTYSAWESSYGGTTHSVQGDPLLTSASNFHLRPTSPCIDAGVDVGLTTDYYGNAIVGLPDIGAIEFQPAFAPAAGRRTGGTFTGSHR